MENNGKKMSLIQLAKVFASFIDVNDREDYINNLKAFMNSYINILARKTVAFRNANPGEYDENIEVEIVDRELKIHIPEQEQVFKGKGIAEQEISTIFGDIEEYISSNRTKEAFYVDCAKIAAEASKQFLSLDQRLQVGNYYESPNLNSLNSTLNNIEDSLLRETIENDSNNIDSLDYYDPYSEKAALAFAYTTMLRAANAESGELKENIKKALFKNYIKDYKRLRDDERYNIEEAEYTILEEDGVEKRVPTMDIIVAQSVERTKAENKGRNKNELLPNIVQSNVPLQYIYSEDGTRLSLYEIIPMLDKGIADIENNDTLNEESKELQISRREEMARTAALRILRDSDARKEIELCVQQQGVDRTLSFLENIQEAEILIPNKNPGIIEAKKQFVDNEENRAKIIENIGEAEYEVISKDIIETAENEKYNSREEEYEKIRREIVAPLVEEYKKSIDELKEQEKLTDEEKEKNKKAFEDEKKDRKIRIFIPIIINHKTVDKSDHSVKNVTKNVDKSKHDDHSTTNYNYGDDKNKDKDKEGHDYEHDNDDNDNSDNNNKEKDRDRDDDDDDSSSNNNDNNNTKNKKHSRDDEDNEKNNNDGNKTVVVEPDPPKIPEPKTIIVEEPGEEKPKDKDQKEPVEPTEPDIPFKRPYSVIEENDKEKGDENKVEFDDESLVDDENKTQGKSQEDEKSTIIINGNPVINNGTIVTDNSITENNTNITQEEIVVDISDDRVENNVNVENNNTQVNNNTTNYIHVTYPDGSEDFIPVQYDENGQIIEAEYEEEKDSNTLEIKSNEVKQIGAPEEEKREIVSDKERDEAITSRVIQVEKEANENMKRKYVFDALKGARDEKIINEQQYFNSMLDVISNSIDIDVFIKNHPELGIELNDEFNKEFINDVVADSIDEQYENGQPNDIQQNKDRRDNLNKEKDRLLARVNEINKVLDDLEKVEDKMKEEERKKNGPDIY